MGHAWIVLAWQMCAPCLYQSSYRDAVRTVVILSAEMGRHSAGENDLVHSVWCTPCGAHRVVPAIWFTLWFSEFELTIIMFAPSQASFKSRPNAIRHLNLYSSLHVEDIIIQISLNRGLRKFSNRFSFFFIQSCCRSYILWYFTIAYIHTYLCMSTAA